jgi:AraC-like DNA-binding protein
MRHTRRRPPADLAEWIEHFWSVSWDFRDCDPFLQQTLPHPNVHVVFEASRSGIAGVTTKRFSRTLEGESRVFGIKFRPGGFRPFLGKPVAMLNDRVIPIETVFGSEATTWESGMLSLKEEEKQIETASAFLRARLPKADENVALATQLVALILDDREIRRVSDLTQCTKIGARSLQRLFHDYVGASPKWVIRRYRLHELVERLKAGEALDGAQMALDLGYSDQAHLINDFRSIVGYSPSRYRSLLHKA